MYDPHPVSEYELTPDGYLRKSGQIVAVPPSAGEAFDLRWLGNSQDADAEAARRFLQTAQTPLEVVGISRVSR